MLSEEDETRSAEELTTRGTSLASPILTSRSYRIDFADLGSKGLRVCSERRRTTKAAEAFAWTKA